MLTALHVFLFSLSVSMDACLIWWGKTSDLMLDGCDWLTLPRRCFPPPCPSSSSSSSSALAMLLLTSESRSVPLRAGQSVEYSISSTQGGSSSSKQLYERREEESYVRCCSPEHAVSFPPHLTNMLNAFPFTGNICKNYFLNIYLFHVYNSLQFSSIFLLGNSVKPVSNNTFALSLSVCSMKHKQDILLIMLRIWTV